MTRVFVQGSLNWGPLFPHYPGINRLVEFVFLTPNRCVSPPGEIHFYGLYRYARPQRLWFFQPFWS